MKKVKSIIFNFNNNLLRSKLFTIQLIQLE